MIDWKKKLRIYDDTGSGDDFDVTNILFEDDDIIVAESENEWYEEPLKVMIYKKSRDVVSKELMFYLVDNK